MRKRTFTTALVLISMSVFLGATVFREDIAQAAQAVSAEIVGPLDAQGNVKVHEQGVAAVKLERDGNVVRIASSTSAPVVVDEVDTPSIEPSLHEGGRFALFGDADRREVIEYVSAKCLGDPMDFIEIGILNGPTFVVPPDLVTGLKSYASEAVRIYAEPGDVGNVIVHQPQGEGNECSLKVSGHLEG